MNPESNHTRAFNVTLLLAVASGIWFVGASPFRQKVVPGGPFISIIGEVVPLAVGVVTIVVGLLRFRQMNSTERWWSLCLFLVATVAIAWSIESVINFWFRPYSRGALIGL